MPTECAGRMRRPMCRYAARLVSARSSDDRKLRGTALEYLESLLPEAVRAPLVQALAQRPEPRAAEVRSETQLLEELKRSIRADLSPQTLTREPD